MKYHTLFFDLDGTLFDYKKAEKIALQDTFKSFFTFSQPGDIFSVYHMINAACWEDYEKGIINNRTLRRRRFAELFVHYHLEGDPGAFSTKYLENLSLGGWTLPGAGELLKKLQGNFRIAALTNGIGDVQKSRISRSGLEDFFEVVVISDIAGYAKPDRKIFEYTMEKMGITSPQGVLMIGDSLSSDITGGINAGLDTCWFNPEHKPSGTLNPTYTAASLDELYLLITEKGGAS